ncbi:MAG TPA: DUF3473 domain-containing protein [Candidatus Atribacteria bacterium]|nr:DUF3473 domain-containing protein [Candidatus Atribacteria bacterium]
MKFFLTIDVEDWFQVENMKGVIAYNQWDSYKIRVVDNIKKILDVLDSFNIKATFFVLGWLAERYPGLVREIHERGHEVASHGYAHELIHHQEPEEFKEDIARAKKILEDIIGDEILGYRAPSFSITDWAVEIIGEVGYKYDSSYCPTLLHNRYGRLNLKLTTDTNTNTGIFKFPNGLIEVSLSTLNLMGASIPWGGGAYFRLLPYPLFRTGIKKILNNRIYVFYFHPWEIDPAQPRIKRLRWDYRLRHYWGLDNTLNKLERLLQDFSFVTIREGVGVV